jgi:hypothetical protein
MPPKRWYRPTNLQGAKTQNNVIIFRTPFIHLRVQLTTLIGNGIRIAHSKGDVMPVFLTCHASSLTSELLKSPLPLSSPQHSPSTIKCTSRPVRSTNLQRTLAAYRSAAFSRGYTIADISILVTLFK